MKTTQCAIIFFLLFLQVSFAQDWSSEASLPGSQECFDFHGHHVCLSDKNRSNIFNFSEEKQNKLLFKGAEHVSQYPVDITAMLVPYRPLKEFFDSKTDSKFKEFIYKIAKGLINMKSLQDVYKWLGLTELPETQNEISPNLLPLQLKNEDHTHMGVSFVQRYGATGMTMSCATCHSTNLFGVEIIGLTNRFPRANDFFILGKKSLSLTGAKTFQTLLKASDEETQIFVDSKKAVKFIEAKSPLVLGLDTSLAQVGLSLSRRAHDPHASRKLINSHFPRKSRFRSRPADSKPSVWWNVKYKTRWLSDGSLISGNPIFTNLLWNEIGRGTDLKELDEWIQDNPKVFQELTAYIFATKAPLYNDFFPNKIDMELAQKGEKLFVNNCSGCHGIYEKGWSKKDSSHKSYAQNIKTIKVRYHTKTPVIDVGTDPERYLGMEELAEELNRLELSQKMNSFAEAQKGYVPPPLVGIWSRFPYFHNNSVPTLYHVLTPDYKRPKSFRMTEALHPETDFDFIKNGYPPESQMREPFKSKRKYLFDTTVTGLSNMGHTKGILLDEFGREKFSHQEKLMLIEFLKTL